MKTPLTFILILAIIFVGCNRESSENAVSKNGNASSDPKEEFAKLNSFLKKFDEPSQKFKVPANKPIRINGKQGTIIFIDPSDLETESGMSVGSEVEIEFKELFNQQQLVKANAQTVSDGQLLVSGGACYISITSGGEKVKLKSGKTFSAAFPKTLNEEMSLYYGQRDSSGIMNWKPAGQNFENQKSNSDSLKSFETVMVIGKDTVRKKTQVNVNGDEYESLLREYKLNEKVYSPVQLNQLGWINCDRLLKYNARFSNVHFEIENKEEEVNYIRVSLIFDDIKSVLQSNYYCYNNKIEGSIFENVPVGMKVRFLAVSYQHNKIFATITDETLVKANHNEKLLLREMSEKEFDGLMAGVK